LAEIGRHLQIRKLEYHTRKSLELFKFVFYKRSRLISYRKPKSIVRMHKDRSNPQYRPLFRSPLATIAAQRSETARTEGWSAEYGGEAPGLVLVRRGCFEVRGRIEVMADAYSALIYDGLHGYRVRRPAEGGDATTRITPTAALMEEALGRSAIHVRITPETHLRHLRLCTLAASPHADALEVEEATVELLHAVARQSLAFDDIRLHAGPRRRIADARAFVAAAPEADHRLAEVAAVAGCSPYHFARLFKQETGSSFRAYRRRLRLALAVQRLADGAQDLTTLAMDTGFSHHSHMTSSFRQALGRSPSAVRECLAPRTFLKAGPAHAA
jgi:AraC-like DNA-binding protein